MSKICKVIKIITPQKIVLNGLWFGPERAESVVIHTHGLGSDAFSKIEILESLADKKTAVVTYSNRGHDVIARLKRIDRRRRKGYRSLLAGAAFEKFIECADDIQGVINFAREQGAKNVCLSGHSTGCQKTVYFLSSKGKQKQVQGVVLLCPVSDWAATQKEFPTAMLKAATKVAKRMVKAGKSEELLPSEKWPLIQSAQRFLSLYTPESAEEIFSYCQTNKRPKVLQKVKVPALLVFAGSDEYLDRPVSEVAHWFSENMKTKGLTIKTIADARHSLQGHEAKVSLTMKRWLKKL